MPAVASLSKKIREITANDAGEPDLYGYVRDLLIRPTFGIGLQDRQVVVDSKLDGSLKRPDLVVYRTEGRKALRGPNHVAGKVGAPVSTPSELYPDSPK